MDNEGFINFAIFFSIMYILFALFPLFFVRSKVESSPFDDCNVNIFKEKDKRIFIFKKELNLELDKDYIKKFEKEDNIKHRHCSKIWLIFLKGRYTSFIYILCLRHLNIGYIQTESREI